MKPTILILLAALAVSGCTGVSHTPLIVTNIETSEGSHHKYNIRVNHTTDIFTDSLYHVGDTIK